MANLNREEKARRDGMAYALKIAKEKGIEGLEEEIKVRNITLVPIALKRAALDECINQIKDNTLDMVLILASMTLKDEFNFGPKRLNQFIERFNEKAECICKGYCTWEDNLKVLKDKCKIELKKPQNDKSS